MHQFAHLFARQKEPFLKSLYINKTKTVGMGGNFACPHRLIFAWPFCMFCMATLFVAIRLLIDCAFARWPAITTALFTATGRAPVARFLFSTAGRAAIAATLIAAAWIFTLLGRFL
jgi:hypothetical protein